MHLRVLHVRSVGKPWAPHLVASDSVAADAVSVHTKVRVTFPATPSAPVQLLLQAPNGVAVQRYAAHNTPPLHDVVVSGFRLVHSELDTVLPSERRHLYSRRLVPLAPHGELQSPHRLYAYWKVGHANVLQLRCT